MTHWLPIESAPEATHILLWFPKGERGVGGMECATVYREEGGEIAFGWTHGGPNAGSDWEFCEQPTHWMPLPDPPVKG